MQKQYSHDVYVHNFPGATRLNFGPSGRCGHPRHGNGRHDVPGISTATAQRIANVLIDISEALVAAAQKI